MTIKMPFRLILCFTLLCSSLLAKDIFYAELYPEGEPERLVYTHTNTFEQRGDSAFYDIYYHTPDGELYAHDKVILINGEPYYSSLDFHQIKEYSSFVRKGDKVDLCFENKGKKKYVTRDMKLPLVFAPTQQLALKGYLKELMNGGMAVFYIYAPETLRLVKMKVTMLNKSKYERPGCVVLQMKPKNMFIDWLVDEVFYVVDIKTGLIMEAHGFSTLRLKENDKWQYRDLDFYYTYE